MCLLYFTETTIVPKNVQCTWCILSQHSSHRISIGSGLYALLVAIKLRSEEMRVRTSLTACLVVAAASTALGSVCPGACAACRLALLGTTDPCRASSLRGDKPSLGVWRNMQEMWELEIASEAAREHLLGFCRHLALQYRLELRCSANSMASHVDRSCRW